MTQHYFSSSLATATRHPSSATDSILSALRRRLDHLRRWHAALAAELYEQRLARDIDRAYAELDARTRRELGIDRRLS